MLSFTRANFVFFAALIAAVIYYAVDLQSPSTAAMTAFKGSCVALLAVWAGLNAKNRDGWLITAVMAFGALGDVLIETHGLIGGGATFFIGHLVAIYLYLRHRQSTPTFMQRLPALLMIPLSLLVAWQMTGNTDMLPGLLLYTLGLSAMAATAWVSRFPRHWVGLGTVLFVVSDMLIFGREGALSGSALPGLLIWPAYFGSQAMIAYGVVCTLAKRRISVSAAA